MRAIPTPRALTPPRASLLPTTRDFMLLLLLHYRDKRNTVVEPRLYDLLEGRPVPSKRPSRQHLHYIAHPHLLLHLQYAGTTTHFSGNAAIPHGQSAAEVGR